jgi:DNA (cytosine-5)-methyltransferase 1
MEKPLILPFNHASFFTGVGGFDFAAMVVGWNNVHQCEIEEENLRELNRLFPNVPKSKDIRDVNGKDFKGTVNAISGGFPCQNISLAAAKHRDGVNGDKSGLWWHLWRITDESRPEFVILENSSTITKQGFEYILSAFAEIGYDAEWYDLQPRYFGVPQKRRERMYAILYPVGFGDRLPQGKVFTGWDEFEYTTWRDTEPKIYGVADVIPGRVGKHRALGNAVAPIIPIRIFQAINKARLLNNH